MKKVIERLEQVLRIIPSITVNNWISDDGLAKVRSLTEEAIAELQALPRWYTLEQWEKRTGKAWPENAAVYMLWQPPESMGSYPFWRIENYAYAKTCLKGVIAYSKNCLAVICATEAGRPPDGWRPEEE
jgi:hypothetical protein